MNTDNSNTASNRADWQRLLILINVLTLVVAAFLTYRITSGGRTKPAHTASELEAMTTQLNEAFTELQELRRGMEMLATELESVSLLKPQAANDQVPESLARFLTEASNPDTKFSAEQVAEKRQELSALVNALSAKQRGQISDEIAEANWLLEAHQLLAETIPTETTEQLAELSTIDALLSSGEPAGSEKTSRDLQERRKSLAANLKTMLSELEQAFRANPASAANDERMTSAVLAANAIGDELTATQRAVPGLALELREWSESADKLPFDQTAPATEETITRLEISQEQGLELQRRVVALELPPPAAFLTKLAEVRNASASAQRRIIGGYQTWALDQIQVVHELGGEKAPSLIDSALTLASKNPEQAVADKTFVAVMSGPAVRSKINELAKTDLPAEGTLTPDQAKAVVTGLYGLTSWSGIKDLAQALNRDLLEQRLLKVDETLLSTPVAKLYAEAFDTCWRYLEGSPYRVEVAKTAAVVEKKQPELPK